ncbi:hypothetical protein DL93DRAFT_354695 [Clavulina sp. PMI_390]|nr:hypothetical protein DL93DRAFT_354695 [Clavulina sp. PMI_390]
MGLNQFSVLINWCFHSHKVSPGLIVGITAGITIFLGILIAILVYIHRRQRSQRTYLGAVSSPDPSYDAPDGPKLSSDALLNRSLTSGQIDSPSRMPSVTYSIRRPAQPPSSDTSVNALNFIQPPTMSHTSGSRSGGSLGTIPESLLSGSLSTGILSSPSEYSLATQPRLNASQTLSGSQYSMGTTQRGSFATLPSTIHYPSIQGTLMTTASSLPGRSTTGVAAYYPTRPTRHATDAGLLMRDGDLGVLQDDTRSLAPPGYLSRETSPTVYVGFSASLPLRPTLEPQPVRAEVE